MLAWRSEGLRVGAAGSEGGSSGLAGFCFALGPGLAGSGGRAAFFFAFAAFFGLGGNTQFLDVVMVKIGCGTEGWGEGTDMGLWRHAMASGIGGQIRRKRPAGGASSGCEV